MRRANSDNVFCPCGTNVPVRALASYCVVCLVAYTTDALRLRWSLEVLQPGLHEFDLLLVDSLNLRRLLAGVCEAVFVVVVHGDCPQHTLSANVSPKHRKGDSRGMSLKGRKVVSARGRAAGLCGVSPRQGSSAGPTSISSTDTADTARWEVRHSARTLSVDDCEAIVRNAVPAELVHCRDVGLGRHLEVLSRVVSLRRRSVSFLVCWRVSKREDVQACR